jgi:hypothetical protein
MYWQKRGVRKDNSRVEVDRKHLGEARGALYMWGRKRILLEGTQAMPSCPSDKDTMRVNKAHLNNIQEFSPYLRENTSHFQISTG